MNKEIVEKIQYSLRMKNEYWEIQIINASIEKISESEYMVSIPVPIQRFIKDVLIDELSCVVKISPFLAFITIGSGIEFLGKCIDDSFPIDWDKSGRSPINFNNAICSIPSLNKYKSLINRADGFDLYDKFRCGLIHGLAPKEKLSLSHGNEQKTRFNEQSDMVNLNIDELYIDFKLACEDIIGKKFKEPNKMNRAKLNINCTVHVPT